jgi:putative transposase
MTSFRRNVVPGGSYFFTVNLADRRSRLLTIHIDLLRAAFRDVRSRHPFAIEAVVVLPDHLHAIWTLPEGDGNFATRWRLIKAAFSRALPLGERGVRQPPEQGRTWRLAATLLGAHAAG